MTQFQLIQSRNNMPENRRVLYPSEHIENRYTALVVVKIEKFGNDLGIGLRSVDESTSSLEGIRQLMQISEPVQQSSGKMTI